MIGVCEVRKREGLPICIISSICLVHRFILLVILLQFQSPLISIFVINDNSCDCRNATAPLPPSHQHLTANQSQLSALVINQATKCHHQ